MLNKASSVRICSCYFQHSSLSRNRNLHTVGIVKVKEGRRRDKNQAGMLCICLEWKSEIFLSSSGARKAKGGADQPHSNLLTLSTVSVHKTLPQHRGDEWWHHYRAVAVLRGWEHGRNTAGTTTTARFCLHSLNKSVGCSSNGSHRSQRKLWTLPGACQLTFLSLLSH